MFRSSRFSRGRSLYLSLLKLLVGNSERITEKYALLRAYVSTDLQWHANENATQTFSSTFRTLESCWLDLFWQGQEKMSRVSICVVTTERYAQPFANKFRRKKNTLKVTMTRESYWKHNLVFTSKFFFAEISWQAILFLAGAKRWFRNFCVYLKKKNIKRSRRNFSNCLSSRTM